MSLPLRSTVKEDMLPLQRALRALEDAKNSLKDFAAQTSVVEDDELSEAVRKLRDGLKKSRKSAKAISELWTRKASY
jgi:hypothetical protein